jgi:hypothetical protein
MWVEAAKSDKLRNELFVEGLTPIVQASRL